MLDIVMGSEITIDTAVLGFFSNGHHLSKVKLYIDIIFDTKEADLLFSL